MVNKKPIEAVVGEYHEYFHISTLITWKKKKWVPMFLWKWVADGQLIEEPYPRRFAQPDPKEFARMFHDAMCPLNMMGKYTWEEKQ